MTANEPVPRTGYLGLGSNIGDRRANLEAAVAQLPAHAVRVLASSSVYETEPVGLVLDQPAASHAWQALAWCVGNVVEFVPLSVRAYSDATAR